MKRAIAAVWMLLMVVFARGCTAQVLEDVFYDTRNTLSIVTCQVDWTRVITDDILIQAQFELRNDTENRIVIRRIGLVLGDEFDLEDVINLDWLDRARFLYTKEMTDPDYPNETKDFWVELQIDKQSIAKELDPGESVTAKFACILKWTPRDISLVQALLLDECETVKK